MLGVSIKCHSLNFILVFLHTQIASIALVRESVGGLCGEDQLSFVRVALTSVNGVVKFGLFYESF